jgi:hypothetical protein
MPGFVEFIKIDSDPFGLHLVELVLLSVDIMLADERPPCFYT